MRILLIILALCISGFIYNNAEALRQDMASLISGGKDDTSPAGVVVMYSQTTCGICKIMAGRMDKAGIRYVRYEIDTDHNRAFEMWSLLRSVHYPNNNVGLPVIHAGKQVFYGMTPINKIQSAMAR